MSDITNKRIEFMDMAKVIMIYIVVLGHYTYALGLGFKPSSVWNLMHIITLFHMPFFFFVSGLFFKPISVKENIKKDWARLLLPYLIMCLVNIMVMIAFDFITKSFSFSKCVFLFYCVAMGNDVPGSGANWFCALWFLYALFIIKLLACLLFKLKNRAKLWLGGVLFISIIMLYCGNILPVRIDSALVGFIFFTMGYLFKQKLMKMYNLSFQRKIINTLLFLLILFMAAFLNLNFEQKQGLSINACVYGDYPLLFLLSGLSGTFIVLILSSSFKMRSSRIKNTILKMSNGTIVILGFHWMVYKLLFSWWLDSYNVLVSFFTSLLNLAVCYFIIILASKYCPAILGNRRIES